MKEERGEVGVEGGASAIGSWVRDSAHSCSCTAAPAAEASICSHSNASPPRTADSSSTTSWAAANPTARRTRRLWHAQRFVDELEVLRAHLGLERFDLYGHSWGGMLATDYALAHQSVCAASCSRRRSPTPHFSSGRWRACSRRSHRNSARRFAATRRRGRPTPPSTRTQSWPSTRSTSAAASRGPRKSCRPSTTSQWTSTCPCGARASSLSQAT